MSFTDTEIIADTDADNFLPWLMYIRTEKDNIHIPKELAYVFGDIAHAHAFNRVLWWGAWAKYKAEREFPRFWKNVTEWAEKDGLDRRLVHRVIDRANRTVQELTGDYDSEVVEIEHGFDGNGTTTIYTVNSEMAQLFWEWATEQFHTHDDRKRAIGITVNDLIEPDKPKGRVKPNGQRGQTKRSEGSNQMVRRVKPFSKTGQTKRSVSLPIEETPEETAGETPEETADPSAAASQFQQAETDGHSLTPTSELTVKEKPESTFKSTSPTSAQTMELARAFTSAYFTALDIPEESASETDHSRVLYTLRQLTTLGEYTPTTDDIAGFVKYQRSIPWCEEDRFKRISANVVATKIAFWRAAGKPVSEPESASSFIGDGVA